MTSTDLLTAVLTVGTVGAWVYIALMADKLRDASRQAANAIAWARRAQSIINRSDAASLNARVDELEQLLDQFRAAHRSELGRVWQRFAGTGGTRAQGSAEIVPPGASQAAGFGDDSEIGAMIALQSAPTAGPQS